MPRQPRLAPPGVALHIVQRGNDRQQCFRVDSDFLLYLATFRELSNQCGCAVHAYCLMTNHVHMLVTPESEASCSLLMKNLGQRYTQYFNSRYGRTGSLWEGRYRSSLVDSAHYVLSCYRYIELNPVRAGLVSDPSAWLWSSYAVNSGGRSDPWISAHPEFAALGSDAHTRVAAYCELIRDGIEASVMDEIRGATEGSYPLVGAVMGGELSNAGCRLAPGRAGRPPKKIRV